MKSSCIKPLVEALLYEGYLLYPYRPSAIKNRQRWTFGGLFPRAFGSGSGDTSIMQTQVLLRAAEHAKIDVIVCFLHLLSRDIGKLDSPLPSLPTHGDIAYDLVPALEVHGQSYVVWEEAVEREIPVPGLAVRDLVCSPQRAPFRFEGERSLDEIRGPDGDIAGVMIRTCLMIQGFVEIAAERLAQDMFRLTVKIANETPLSPTECADRNAARRRSLASTHTILKIGGGEFISLLDPPDELRAAAALCDNRGTWPVLIGEESERDAMLSSPIILYDYPAIAPESPGDLFDGTEIDEILTLRILAMTDAEKREAAATDARARALLLRTETLAPVSLSRLHGTMRAPQSSHAAGLGLTVGAHVRLRPNAAGDIMDLALKDKVAVVEAIEHDFEDRIHVAVTLLDDPGRDLGASGFPGHRFYFSPEEIEPLSPEDRQ